VELASGNTINQVCKGLGISEHIYYRWNTEEPDVTDGAEAD
jgi:hypothetical protein